MNSGNGVGFIDCPELKVENVEVWWGEGLIHGQFGHDHGNEGNIQLLAIFAANREDFKLYTKC